MVNKGVVILNKKSVAQKTVIVLGVARSGTTMTANVIEHLGVDMGQDKKGVVNERHEVFSLLENNKLADFEEFVLKQNSEFDMWGWKRPKAVQYVDKFHSRVRNPHYIVPFRDYMAIAMRNNLALDIDIKKNLQSTHANSYAEVLKFVNQCDAPMLLFSYEKANTYKHHFVNKMADFLDVSDSKKIKAAIASIDNRDNAYVQMDNIKGRIDKVADGVIHGWANRPDIPKPLKLKLFIDGKLIKTFMANKPRPDLKRIGNRAFVVPIPDNLLTQGGKYRIVIRDMRGSKLPTCPHVYTHQVESAE